MKERPILMNGEMVRAILDGRKTQTRRPLKPQLTIDGKRHPRWEVPKVIDHCPYGQPGDQLYVRETFQALPESTNIELMKKWAYRVRRIPGRGVVTYRASNIDPDNHGWRPSIHMPKWAARIWLEIVDVRVETLQQIRCHGGVKEGFFCYHASYECAVDSFREVWDATYADKGLGWEADPWVWVVEFVVVER